MIPLTPDVRRVHRRLPAAANRSCLAWECGGDGLSCCRIRDISLSGALLAAPAERADDRVLLRLLGPAGSGWVAGRVVRQVAGGVAVAFEGICPEDLLLSATMGVSFEHLFRAEAAGDGGWELPVPLTTRQ